MTFLFFIVETQGRLKIISVRIILNVLCCLKINTGMFVPIGIYSCRKGGSIDGTDQRI